MRRKTFLGGISAALCTGPFTAPASAAGFTAQLAALERSTGGRLGVCVIDTASGQMLSYRGSERFPMCSTFKFLAVAAVLSRVDEGREHLDRRIPYGAADLLEYAPVARAHVSQGYLTVRDLCAAASEYSDNTAANLLLKTMGGPQAVTRYARSLGDKTTRLDRTEPELNTGLPGDPRDTTAPAATANDMQRVLLGGAISPSSAAMLEQWMMQCRTGLDLIRAAFPSSWRAGDKSGTGGPHNAFGDSNTRNDIAIVRPPQKHPVIITAYLTGSQLRAAQRDAVLARVGSLVRTGAGM